MIDDKPIELGLLYGGEALPIKARITTLTPDMVRSKMTRAWWKSPALKGRFRTKPIDRHWDWNHYVLSYEDRVLAARKVAAVVGRGDDLIVEGAMLISADPVASALEPGEPCLLLELLFTAPHNRPDLRRDGQRFVLGVGLQLLIWGAWFSRSKGCGGRLRLDSSPEQVVWYEKRGLQKIVAEPIVYEEVTYTPMELSAGAAEELIALWES